MFHTPLLRAVNLSIAVLLVAILIAAYWFAWRPLPQTSGQISAPISLAGKISRDKQGVPHIQAGSAEDALFLEGYAMAQDRLWQMDALRRRAAGELAEVLGRQALGGDQDARTIGMRRIAEEQESQIPARDRAVFAAFARGVNYFISTHRNRLPVEFKILNYDPRPWRVRDSILAGLEMYRTLTTTWRTELAKVELLERGDPAKLRTLFPSPSDGGASPGSNAWAISGTRSATGKPILANDPHLEYSIPSPWYLVHLQTPDLNVTGATIVGLPAVIVGHNQRIAWGVTNLEYDVQDLYREQIDLTTGRYLFQGKPEQARLDRDVIAVKGEAPMPVATWITRHGPVILNEGSTQYSFHWIAADPGSFRFPFLELDQARNWDEFKTAVGNYPGPGQNFVYADVDGNIGYHTGGRVPIRKTCAGDVPSDGVRGDCEWEGYLPFDQLPQVFNPSSGMVASANQNPFTDLTLNAEPAGAPGKRDFGTRINGRFASRYRVEQIRARLASKPKWKPEEMISIERDVYSAYHVFLAGQVVAAWDKQKAKHPDLEEAAGELRKWNGQMQVGQGAPMLAALVADQIRKLLTEATSAGLGEAHQNLFSPEMMERILKTRPAGWFPDWDAALIRALSGALDAGRQFQGPKVAAWDLGQSQPLRILNPIVGQFPVIGKYFNIGPFPMSGSPWSVMQYTRRLGPSLRMIVDFSDLDHSLINLATGESGQPLSKHYKDQWDAYYNGRSFPMQFGKVESDEVLVVNPER